MRSKYQARVDRIPAFHAGSINCFKCAASIDAELEAKLKILAEIFGGLEPDDYICDACYLPHECPPDCDSCKWERDNLSEN